MFSNGLFDGRENKLFVFSQFIRGILKKRINVGEFGLI